MCWSGQASAVLATFGLSTTAYLIKKGEDKRLWMSLGYFSLMELLQAVTYIYINECTLPINKLLTTLGYVHVMFQCFFVNMASMYFIPKQIETIISKYVYGICSIVAVLFAIKLYPFSWSNLCSVGNETFCGPFACSMKGEWHIAWQLPLNDILSSPLIGHWIRGLHACAYTLGCFVLPILYGSWRVILVTFLMGPFIASFTTHNVNEFPAIWCLFSIALCLSIIKSPIRKYLHTRNWFLYPLLQRFDQKLILSDSLAEKY